MTKLYMGYTAAHWRRFYLDETKVSEVRGMKIRDLEIEVEKQRRAIKALLEERAQNAAIMAATALVVNKDTPTLEQRINKLEDQIEAYSEMFDAVGDTINLLVNKLKTPEPVEPKDAVVKGAAMLDVQDTLNRRISEARYR